VNPNARPHDLAALDANSRSTYTFVMPVVEFTGNEWGAALAANAPAGGRLVDICDGADAPVAFSCRSARCATCRVQVLEGSRLIEPPGADEAALLQSLAAAPNHRLACQAVVRPLPGRICLKWVGAP
jgi:ferredoxin